MQDGLICSDVISFDQPKGGPHKNDMLKKQRDSFAKIQTSVKR